MSKILAINGSYREQGATAQAIEVASDYFASVGAEVEVINLRDYPIHFCVNCRECTQQPGENPGNCVMRDGMAAIIHKIETADGFILASPTNMGSVTALFKRFMERLTPYAYWPWGAKAPQPRKAINGLSKKALLIASGAAPGLLGRWLFHTTGELKHTAAIIGAKPIAVVYTGLMGMESKPQLPNRTLVKLKRGAAKILQDTPPANM